MAVCPPRTADAIARTRQSGLSSLPRNHVVGVGEDPGVTGASQHLVKPERPCDDSLRKRVGTSSSSGSIGIDHLIVIVAIDPNAVIVTPGTEILPFTSDAHSSSDARARGVCVFNVRRRNED